MPGVQRFDHRQHLRAPELADDQTVGAESQCCSDQLGHPDRVDAVEPGRSGLQSDDMVSAVEDELARVFDQHESLSGGDRVGECRQEGRLSR